MLERLSPRQRQVLAALEVDCFLARQAQTAAALPASGAGPSAAAGPAMADAGTAVLLLLVESVAERDAPLLRALARTLGADVRTADQPRPDGAVLVSLGAAAPAAALTLPPLATLRAEPRAKQRSWLKIRSFLGLRRRATPP